MAKQKTIAKTTHAGTKVRIQLAEAASAPKTKLGKLEGMLRRTEGATSKERASCSLNCSSSWQRASFSPAAMLNDTMSPRAAPVSYWRAWTAPIASGQTPRMVHLGKLGSSAWSELRPVEVRTGDGQPEPGNAGATAGR
jgi:hypothetical protein